MLKQQIIAMTRTIQTAVAVALIVVSANGCGQHDKGAPTKVSISGKVTYDGKPLPSGRIEFEPDPKYGNKGPVVSIDVKNGEYAAPAAQGPISGPHLVRIFFGDDAADASAKPGSAPSPYKTGLDLPKNKLVFNFNIPPTKK